MKLLQQLPSSLLWTVVKTEAALAEVALAVDLVALGEAMAVA
jgi:hypothetical protein